MRKAGWTIWLGLAGLFITIIGSSSLLAFKIGGVNEKVITLEKDMSVVKDDISKLKDDVG